MTVFYPEKRGLFLHIPRTGGGWVQYVSKKLSLEDHYVGSRFPKSIYANHRPPAHYVLDCARDGLFIDFIWVVVRNPIDYYESVWGWLHKNPHDTRETIKNKWSWDAMKRAAELYSPDFNEWVEAMIKDQGGWVTRLFWLYTGPPGGEFVQFIGKTETLQEDFISAMRQMGFDKELDSDFIQEARKPHGSGRIRKKISWDACLL